jgi:filamentous hemagglutinin family protein
MPVYPSSTATGSSHRDARRFALLAGTSALALMLATAPSAYALPFGTSGATVAPPMVATNAQMEAAQQAARIAKQARDSLSRATQALEAMQGMQAAARAAAQAASTPVTDGLSAGGLIVDPRVTAGTDPSLWVNVKAPTQATSNGHVTVTAKQTAPRAIATWQQFNVGRNTTLYFDQSAGNAANGNSWTILNRIDATGSPSQILGQIKAEGTVLVINPNGIIFNGTSQINVHSLIASSLDLNSFTGIRNGAFKDNGNAYVPLLVNGLAPTAPSGTLILAPSDEANANATFLAQGLFINSGFNISVNGSPFTTGLTALFSAGRIPGQTNAGIRLEPGALITTDVSGFDNGGYVALLGPSVTNAGSIATSAGQIILAAGSSVQIASPAPKSTQTSYAVRAGSGISGNLFYTPPSPSGVARVINEESGILVARRGNITLYGDAIKQAGLTLTTTSITRPGSITIAANGPGPDNQVLFGSGSLTAILPERNGEDIPSDADSLAKFNVTIDGHTSYINPLNGRLTVYVPTLVRTGTGSITIAAAGDFALRDTVSPGAVYTAGHVADNAEGFTAPTLPTSLVSSGVLTNPVWATGGGNITITAGRDIIGIETPTDPGNAYSTNGSSAGVSTGQFWNPWYYVNGRSTGSVTAPFDPAADGVQYSSWINYGTFFQGLGALGGGNVTLEAARNVKDISASLPETSRCPAASRQAARHPLRITTAAAICW